MTETGPYIDALVAERDRYRAALVALRDAVPEDILDREVYDGAESEEAMARVVHILRPFRGAESGRE